MATWILASIDGTDSTSWRVAPSASIVYHFYDMFRTEARLKTYAHGPNFLGTNSVSIAATVESFILGAIASIEDRDIRVCLVGYSRGAAIAIHVASRLPIQVYFAVLIDPVNLTPITIGLGANLIPEIRDLNDTDCITNVRYTYRAIRSFTPVTERFNLSELYPNTGYSSLGYLITEQFTATTHESIGYGRGRNYPTPTNAVFNRVLDMARAQELPI